MGSLTICKQWKIIFIPANSKGNQNGKNEEQQKFFQKLQIISEQVTVSEVHEDFQQSLQNVTAHVNLKRIQACVFHEDIKEAKTRVVQVDYAMAYQCQQQSEVQSALWTRGNVNISTCAVYHSNQTKTFLICTDYKVKIYKFSNGTFLEYLYENELHDKV